MYTLYCYLALMLFIALTMLVLPLRNKKFRNPRFFKSLLFMSLFSFLLYQFTGDKQELSQWFASGKRHYELRGQFNELGGVDGAIAAITKKLNDNPNDVKGWLLLAKLYQSKNDVQKANEALARAQAVT